MIKRESYVRTDREQAFLDGVEDTKHQREIITGLAPFFDEKAPADMLHFYGGDEIVHRDDMVVL